MELFVVDELEEVLLVDGLLVDGLLVDGLVVDELVGDVAGVLVEVMARLVADAGAWRPAPSAMR